MSLRRRLSILVVIGLTPPFLLTVFDTARWQIRLEEDARSEAITGARLVSSEIAQTIESGRQLLVAISKYPAIPTNETECATYFKSVIADLPLYRAAAVIDVNGKFHCSTIPIPPDLDVTDRAYFREPLATGQLTIGILTKGRVTHLNSIHLSMPYQSADGSLSGVIVLVFNPEQLAHNVATLSWRPRDRSIVLDRHGSLVLTVPRDNIEDAEKIAHAIFPKLVSTTSETIDTDVLPHRPQIIGFTPINQSLNGLVALTAVDRNTALAGAWNFAARSLTIGVATMLLAIGGIWIATHIFVIRPLRVLIEIARRREGGDTTLRFPAMRPLTEFGQLSSSLSRMSDKVDELLGQKALLLRELQHRVMNSLNLLSSVLDIQGRQRFTTDVTREQLARARDRVVAMGTVYRHLYISDAVDELRSATCCEPFARKARTLTKAQSN